MGVIYVQEENPWAEFLEGLTPIATAWGNRYIDRHRGKLINDIYDYGQAKPQFMKMEDISDTANSYQPAKPEMFSDDAFGDYSQMKFNSKTQTQNTGFTPDFTNMKFNENRNQGTRFSYPDSQFVAPDFLINKSVAAPSDFTKINLYGDKRVQEPISLNNPGYINTQTIRTLEDVKKDSENRIISAQNAKEILNQRNAQIQTEFDMAQAQRKKDLIQRGASLFGSEYTNAMVNQQDQRRAFQNLKYDIHTPVEEFYQSIGNTHLKNGDFQSAFNYFRAADEARLRNRVLFGR